MEKVINIHFPYLPQLPYMIKKIDDPTTNHHEKEYKEMSTIALSRPARRPSVLGHVTLALRVWQERQALKRLDQAALNDLGISRREAMTEAAHGLGHLPAGRL